MHIKPECITCLLNQTLKVTKLLQCDDALSKRLLDDTAKILIQSTLEMTPPQIAKDTYANIAKITGLEDPIQEAKQRATKEALKVDTSFVQTLHDAIKLSAIGNVIDFGAQKQLDLNQTIQSHFSKAFGIDDFQSFEASLKDAKSLVYIGDNTGEHIFDKILIEHITKHYDIELFYFTRGRPIINDVTLKEAQHLKEVATLVDSGVPTPGFDLRYATQEAKNYFEEADIVLAKGMGNYESLYGVTSKPIFYLFIVKCSVVSADIGVDIGELIFKKFPS
jgi:hypothetical protein